MRVRIHSTLQLIDWVLSWSLLRAHVKTEIPPGEYEFVMVPNPYGPTGGAWYVLSDDRYVGLPCADFERRTRWSGQLRIDFKPLLLTCNPPP